MREFTQADLEAYLDEALTPDETVELETQLRDDQALLGRLQAIIGRRDAGVHSLGEIWRRHRITCSDRETLGSYLMNLLDPEQEAYIRFHLEQIGCRYCHANLEDLRQKKSAKDGSEPAVRRQRYFQSSAGYLADDKP